MKRAGDATTVMVVVDGEAVVARWRIEDPARPDLSMVETMARLYLASRRLGLEIRLEHSSAEVGQLLDLVGLADLLLDASRQAKGGEQLGVKEVVEPGDPVT
ncbi:MAG TPA: hypothetical protein VF711_10125 [Acidimicrobiales bacterium]